MPWMDKWMTYRGAAGIGAGIGAAWGLVSDDTSVLGGAVKGAGLGIGAKFAGRQYTRLSLWNGMRGAQPVIPVMSSFTWGGFKGGV